MTDHFAVAQQPFEPTLFGQRYTKTIRQRANELGADIMPRVPVPRPRISQARDQTDGRHHQPP